MRALVIGVLVSCGVAGSAMAQYQPYRPPTYSYTPPPAPKTTHSYDWQSGNSYTTTVNPDGSSRTQGLNMQSGSMWNSRTDTRGNSQGTDSRGNMWTYNPSNGSYMSTDGTVCVGQGAARICNK